MKGLWKFFVGIVLGALLGWGAGFLRFPAMENNRSFWVGFGACLALVLFVVAMVFFGNKKAHFTKLFGKKSTPNDSPTAGRTYSIVWIILPILVAIGAGIGSLMIYQRQQLLETKTQIQDQRIREQSELIAAIRKNNLAILMSSVLDKVDAELEHNPGRTLSDSTIARVVALSYSYKPYAYFDGDSLSVQRLSPERGHLLLALSVMGIDSASFAKIKQDGQFSAVDLCGANLKGADLSGADLKGGNLKDADLSGANLSGTDLRGANLWGAHLNNANLSDAEVRRADMRWAELNGANLKMAKLDGVDLSNAQLRKADLEGAKFRWAKAANAMLDEAHLVGVDFQGTDLNRANLSKADMRESNIKWVILNDAHLEGVDLTDARVEDTWVENIQKWQFGGIEQIRTGYEVVKDTSGRYDAGLMLKKK